jgi:hybrid cluster-associated redox disulfide protein
MDKSMSKITKDMTISQVLEVSRATAPVFFSMGMHCLGCPMSAGETVEEACAAHGVDVQEIVKKLNEAVED